MARKIILRMARNEGKQTQPANGYVRRILPPFQAKEDKQPVTLRLSDGTRLGRAMLVKRKRPAYQDWLNRKRQLRNIPSY